MKLRSKLLLSATCLLTISVAATATSAYAWFVSNRQASVAISQADVKTNATNLYIKGVGGTLANGDTVVFSDAANETSVSGVGTPIMATDISGDGESFFKPKLDPNFLTNGMATVIESVSNKDTTYYYHQFRFVFTQSNTDIKTGVYLGNGSTVKSTAKTEINPALRVAFLVDNSVKLMWAPNGSGGQSHYLKDTSKLPVQINAVADSPLPTKDSKELGLVSKLSYETEIEDVNDASSNNDKMQSKFLLGNLTSNSSLTVTVRVWFEGMDSSCVTNNIATDVAANFKFYGVNMDF